MDLAQLITSGGDERIRLKENGLNKYFANPAEYEGILNRGSCTCNTLTPESKVRIDDLMGEVDDTNFGEMIKRQREEIKELINPKEKDSFELFFAPSGSDLSYYPLLFQQLINPGKTVHNVITCPEELGSGTLTAASGKYFFKDSQFEEEVKKGDPISDDLKIEVITFPARDEEGNIIDHKEEILQTLRSYQEGDAVIANMVIGSKSGIEDNITIVPRTPDYVMWVVDMCQLRAPKRLISRLLDLHVMVMITGSKFYQAPPFCGALIVPNSIINKFKNVDDESIFEPFKNIFSKFDFPERLTDLRKHFRDYKNYGLLSRWEAALVEMRQISKYNVNQIIHNINLWHTTIVEELNKNEDLFELIPDMEITNKTIISFRIKNRTNTYLSENELRQLYQEISLNDHEGLGDSRKLLIGQPVNYGDQSFIRLALGSYPIRSFIRNGFNPDIEKRVVGIIKEMVQKMYW